jgi:hypothetical protein
LLFEPTIKGTAWDVEFTIHNWKYQHAYYLVDGVYPLWSTLVKAKGVNQDAPLQHFQKLPKAFWKEIKQAFGVLQSKWVMVTIPAHFWSPHNMWKLWRLVWSSTTWLWRITSKIPTNHIDCLKT